MRLFSAVMVGTVLAVAVLPGCAAESGEELGEDGWEGESASTGSVASEISGAPSFQLPFPCGQVWSGQTRTDHRPQLAVDFNRANDEGDTVLAAASGRVTRVGNFGNTSYGRWIEIAHGNGYATRYAHLSSQVVSVGQQVTRGQKIGTVGNTGGSTGAHLHYEQRRNGYAQAAVFGGVTARYYGTRNYTSGNCGGGGGGDIGRVDTAGADLTVRSGPGTSYSAVGFVADGTKVVISCQERGQSVSGTFGTSKLWDKIGSGRFISDAYVYTGTDGRVAPDCP